MPSPPRCTQSVSFSGFGSFYSQTQYDTRIKNENKAYQPSSADGFLATTFVPSHDIVPMVDTHRGSIQHTVCSSNGIIACHSINAMTCDLLYRCGDNQNQQRFKSCIGPFQLVFNEAELDEKLQGWGPCYSSRNFFVTTYMTYLFSLGQPVYMCSTYDFRGIYIQVHSNLP